MVRGQEEAYWKWLRQSVSEKDCKILEGMMATEVNSFILEYILLLIDNGITFVAFQLLQDEDLDNLGLTYGAKLVIRRTQSDIAKCK